MNNATLQHHSPASQQFSPASRSDEFVALWHGAERLYETAISLSRQDPRSLRRFRKMYLRACRQLLAEIKLAQLFTDGGAIQ
jgi:hypothetical protein